MSTKQNNYSFLRLLPLLAMLLVPRLLPAQESFWSVTQSASVEITPLNASIQCDSVTLHWQIRVSDIRVRRTHSHVLVPILRSGNHSFSLPPVIISGRKRASYDRRERALDPFQRRPYSVSIYHRRRPVDPIYYMVSFPYSSWMEHCSLDLRQLSEGAWHSTLLSDDRLCKDLFHRVIPKTATADTLRTYTPAHAPLLLPDTVHKAPVAAPVAATVAATPAAPLRISLFLAYPVGFSGVSAQFANNASELAKLDSLLLPLLSARRLHIRVTGYCSPEGLYAHNEQLARRRAREFVHYLRTAYPLPAATTVRTAWVAEDWQGLREHLERSTLPLRHRVMDIIDHTDVFEGRERELMELDNGNLYRTLKQTIFPQLRRIELVVEQVK